MVFSCRLDNAKAIATILSCLSHGTRKDQHAQCEVRRPAERSKCPIVLYCTTDSSKARKESFATGHRHHVPSAIRNAPWHNNTTTVCCLLCSTD